MTRKTIAKASVGETLYRKERGKYTKMGKLTKKEKPRTGYHVTLDDDGRTTTYNAGGATVVWCS